MDQETIEKLTRLRRDTLAKAPGIDGIRKILCQYFPIGTKIIITKDYWTIEEEK